jgi:uncharacterized protein YndB with AHSA1/START domain
MSSNEAASAVRVDDSADASVVTQVYRVYIKTTPEAVWQAIVDPEWNSRYGYAGRGEFDLRPGGAYVGYTNEFMRSMGAPEIGVDGEVLECDPPKRLVQTWRMLMDEAMVAEGFTRLTWEIEPQAEGIVRLTVTHELGAGGTLVVLMSGGLEDQGAGGGWPWVLSDLKSLLETGATLKASGGH